MTDLEDRIIRAVFKRNALWDPTNPMKRQSRMLSLLWQDVEKEIGIPARKVRQKWKNLRGYYIEQLRKIELGALESPENEIKEESITWRHFSTMSFLRNSLSLNKNDNKTDDEDDDYEIPDSPIPSAVYIRVKDDPLDTTYLKVQMDQMQKRKFENGIENYTNKKPTMSNDVSNIIEEENEDYLFFKSLLSSMRLLSPVQKLIVRSKIQNIILESIVENDNN